MSVSPVHITPASEIAPQALTDLINRNLTYWKPFFPLTVKKNRTLTLSLLFLIENEVLAAEEKQFLYGVQEAKHNTLIGLVYLKEIDWTLKKGELAYAIDKEFSGRGSMTKIVRVVSQKAFALGLEQLAIIAHKSNSASVAVALKSGYLWEKTLSSSFTPEGKEPLDMELYTLKKEHT